MLGPRKYGVLFCIALAVNSCRSIHSAQDSGLSAEGDADQSEMDKRASEVRFQRFRESQASVVRTVLNSPGQVGQDFRDSIDLKSSEIFTSENVSRDQIRGIRLSLAALMKNPVSRELSFRASLDAIRYRSSVLKQYFSSSFAGTDTGLMNTTYDVVIVGAGPSAVIHVQQLTQKNPNLKVLVIDSKNKPGGTFADVNAGFLLNSTNRKNEGERPTRGRGDLNYLADLLGMPDFEGIKWPVSGKWGKLATTLFDMSSADLLLETDLVSATKDGKSLTLKDVGTGETFNVSAEKIVLTTGLGEPREIFNSATQQSIDAETKALTLEKERTGIEKPTSVEGFGRAMDRIGTSQTPLRPYMNETVTVVGGGDSSKVFLEFLFRLGPEEAYRRDVAQVGKVGQVYWFVPFETCEEFLNGNEKKDIQGTRSRYARLFGEISAGNIKLVPGRVVDTKEMRVTQADGTVRIEREVVYLNKDNKTLSSVKDGFAYADPKTEGPIEQRIRMDRGTSSYVITTVGFLPTRLQNLLAPLSRKVDLSVRKNFLNSFEYLEAPLREYGNVVKRYALRFRKTNFFVSGPAADAVGKPLPEGRELAGVNANTVSVFANGPREREFVDRELAPMKSVAKYSSSILKRLLPLSYDKKKATKTRSGQNVTRTELAQARIKPNFDSSALEYATTVNPELELRVELDRLSQKLETIVGGDLKMTVRKTNTGFINIVLRGAPEGSGSERVLKESGERLAQILETNYFRKGSRTTSIDINIPTFGEESTRSNPNLITIQENRGNPSGPRPKATAQPVTPQVERGLSNPTITQREQISLINQLIKEGTEKGKGNVDNLIELKYLLQLTEFELSAKEIRKITERGSPAKVLDRLVNLREGREEEQAKYLERTKGKNGASAQILEIVADLWSNCCANRAQSAAKSRFNSQLQDLGKVLESGKIDFGSIASDLMVLESDSRKGNLSSPSLFNQAFERMNSKIASQRSLAQSISGCSNISARVERILINQ